MTGLPTESLKARIFDIQRCALDDGPGVRTSIFFKGCSLSCIWCHNPESISPEPRLSYLSRLCTACGACTRVCPSGAHAMERVDGENVHRVYFDKCSLSGECLDVCCYQALDIAGREYTSDQLISELESDLPYFSLAEGGGITLTGGEPMIQTDFLLDFLTRLEGVHVCIETSGFAAPEDFRKILPHIDLFLFDYKVTDPVLHRELCGSDNRLILENLDILCSLGARIVLRCPLVPGINDQEEHLKGIAGIMNKYPGIEYCQILPYHTLGESKLERFGLDIPPLKIKAPGSEIRERWMDVIGRETERRITI
jgi:pyruvate formate lyase activating enzyme